MPVFPVVELSVDFLFKADLIFVVADFKDWAAMVAAPQEARPDFNTGAVDSEQMGFGISMVVALLWD